MNLDKNTDTQTDKSTQPTKEKNSFLKELIQWLQALVISILLISLLFVFVGRPFTVNGVSMYPSFYDYDKVIALKSYSDVERGDVVVVRRAGDTSLIKRVIAVEGDVIDININTGDVTLNGVIIDEPYINERTYTNSGTTYPLTLGEGELFVMGDNRNYSSDSRNKDIGIVHQSNIYGKVVYIVFPLDRIGAVE